MAGILVPDRETSNVCGLAVQNTHQANETLRFAISCVMREQLFSLPLETVYGPP